MSPDVNCVDAGKRKELQRTCPVCKILFHAVSAHRDRRPLVACVNGHTICADCRNTYHKPPDGKCPTCGYDISEEETVNQALMELIENCASVLEIPFSEIHMKKKPFARGGFGAVYDAQWRDAIVVVKVIEAESEEEKQAVKSEASLTLRLNHPHVIELFCISWMPSNKPGIVMEKAKHGSLDMWIGKIDHDKLIKIALGIIDGLEYVHLQHVIHRDIKPKNILMCGQQDDMIPKIADFGVSKVIETLMMTQSRVGQELYMAPEVRLNLQYNFTADIYSLAMSLFEMFNEQLIQESPKEVNRFILQLHSGKDHNIPSSCKVPRHLRNVIEGGWCGNPDNRPALTTYRFKLKEYRSSLQGYFCFDLNNLTEI